MIKSVWDALLSTIPSLGCLGFEFFMQEKELIQGIKARVGRSPFLDDLRCFLLVKNVQMHL